MRSILATASLGLFVGNAYCSYSTPERQIVDVMTMEIQQYHSKYGVPPTQWNELDEFGTPLDEYFQYAPPSKRYTFVRGFQLPPPLRGEIVAVTRKPSYDVTLSPGLFGRGTKLRGPGRYLILQNQNGNFSAEWMTEDYIIRAFAEASQPLPTPDNEPEPKSISNARIEIYVRRCFYVFLILSPIGCYWMITGGKRTTEQDGGGKPAT